MTGWTFWCLFRDYRSGKELTSITVASVWALYLLHFVLELYAAWRHLYPIEFGQAIFITFGILLVITGTVIYTLGILHLRSIQRMSGVDTSQLITAGIYSWTRNPQNVGWILFLFGIGFMACSGLALLMALIFVMLFMIYVPMEERHLESIYGEEYRKYERNSHRYFGFPR